jgi:hypothetical protein
VQRQASARGQSTIHAVKAALQEGPAWLASTRRHATNVKYALSTFLRDRRT